jgi:hypothetical protein
VNVGRWRATAFTGIPVYRRVLKPADLVAFAYPAIAFGVFAQLVTIITPGMPEMWVR